MNADDDAALGQEELDSDVLEKKLKRLTVARVLKTLEKHLTEEALPQGLSGRLLVPRRPVSLFSAVEEALIGPQAAARDSLEETYSSTVGEGLRNDCWFDERFFTRVDEDPSWLVYCSNPSSMVSGAWGLRRFAHGGRGYIFSVADEDPSNELRVLTAWEPESEGRLARYAHLVAYRDSWREIGLPPIMGERVTGIPGLLFTAVNEILKAHPDEWDSGPFRIFSDSTRKTLILKAANANPEIEALAHRAACPAATVQRILHELLDSSSNIGARATKCLLGADEQKVLVWLFLDLIWGP